MGAEGKGEATQTQTDPLTDKTKQRCNVPMRGLRFPSLVLECLSSTCPALLLAEIDIEKQAIPLAFGRRCIIIAVIDNNDPPKALDRCPMCNLAKGTVMLAQ